MTRAVIGSDGRYPVEPVFANLPPLRSVICELEQAADDAALYAVRWIELSDLHGGGATVVFGRRDSEDARGEIMSGHLCDADEYERRVRWEALTQHLGDQAEAYAAVRAELIRLRRVMDNRPCSLTQAKAVLRAFLALGGRVIRLDASTRFEMAGDAGLLLGRSGEPADEQRAREAAQTAFRAMSRSIYRPRFRRLTERALRQLGQSKHGWTILEAAAS